MKLKRLKEEYISVRKELYNRIEEINGLQHELVECRFKNDYNLHLTNQTLSSLKSVRPSPSLLYDDPHPHSSLSSRMKRILPTPYSYT